MEEVHGTARDEMPPPDEARSTPAEGTSQPADLALDGPADGEDPPRADPPVTIHLTVRGGPTGYVDLDDEDGDEHPGATTGPPASNGVHPASPPPDGPRAAGPEPATSEPATSESATAEFATSGVGAPEPPAAASTPPEAAPAKPRRRIRIPKTVRGAIAVIILIFVVEYLLLPEIASARKSINLLGQVDVWKLIVAVVLEGLALFAYAELTNTVLAPSSPSRFRIFRINMSSLAVSHVVPGGTAPGTAVGYRLLIESGVPGSTAGTGLAIQGVGSAVVLNVLFWLALLISIPLNGFNPLYGFAAILGVLLLGAFAGTVMLLTRGEHAAADQLHRAAQHIPFVNPDTVSRLTQKVADRLAILMKDKPLLAHAFLWAACNWLFDAASLWVFLYAFGTPVFPIDLLVAYGLVNILAAIPITPGGLGVVEGVLIPTLVGFGVPKDVAILGVLSWRLVNFWLPIPAGGVSYLSLRFGAQGRELRAMRATTRPPKGQAAG